MSEKIKNGFELPPSYRIGEAQRFRDMAAELRDRAQALEDRAAEQLALAAGDQLFDSSLIETPPTVE